MYCILNDISYATVNRKVNSVKNAKIYAFIAQICSCSAQTFKSPLITTRIEKKARQCADKIRSANYSGVNITGISSGVICCFNIKHYPASNWI